MGAEQSNVNINEYVITKLTNELTDYVSGQIPKESLRYKFFLMNANNYFNCEHFFKKVDINQIADYIGDLGVIDMKEAKIIIQQILQISNCEKVATDNLQTILPKMRIKFEDTYISPTHSEELFNQIFSIPYSTQWGKYSPNSFINWKSTDIFDYKQQKRETLDQIYQNLYQLNYFIKESMNEERSIISCPVLHSEDISAVVSMNYVEKLFEGQNGQMHQGVAPFKKRISRPANWRKNIHEAAFYGDEQSLSYCLHLLPILLNCPDEKGDTPAHKAAAGDRGNIIKMLKGFGADFRQMNDEGRFPHHMSTGKNSILAFNSIGVDVNERDSKGKTLLELRCFREGFSMSAIETLLGLGVDLFEPNPSGVYVMQIAVHEESYTKEMDFVSFQKKVRKIVQKSMKKEIYKDADKKEIIERKVNKCDEEDTADMNKSVDNKDINRVKVLLALGAHADRVRKDGKTNLMLCAERNDCQIAELLVNNFCGPNFKNERGENTFWVASYLMNLNTATVLRDHGANVNEPSSSGDTILHVAYRERKMDLFKFLLDSGCSPNVKNKNQESVLYQAFVSKDDEIAELLQTSYNGDINTKGIDGNSLAHIALLEHDFERLEYYIQRGIDLENKDNYGYSIFMISITMLDDLQLCSSLLKHGSDINTQDNDGNTALLNILHLKNFDRNKFDFLVNNNCNINLHNSIGEYPISACIVRELDDEAQLLLDKNCVIQDINNEYEPIVCALKIESQKWFEKLLEHGASASNTRYPVLANYINSNFFFFDFMKKFSSMNVVLGAPIQAAIRKGYNEVANYLWDASDEQTRIEIAKTSDNYGMILFSAAIAFNVESLVDKLLCGNYEVMKPDLENRTSFIYACKANRADWMESIFIRISAENANHVDKYGNSALTYAANNKNVQFCNFLFIHDIDIFSPNIDNYGIIDSYQKLVNRVLEYKVIASENMNQSISNYEMFNTEVNHILAMKENLEARLRMDHHDGMDEYDVMPDLHVITMQLRITQDNLYAAYERRDNAQRIKEKYKDRYDRISEMTRKDMLTNFHMAVSLAQNDGEIRVSRNISVNSETDAFMNDVFGIIGVTTNK